MRKHCCQLLAWAKGSTLFSYKCLLKSTGLGGWPSFLRPLFSIYIQVGPNTAKLIILKKARIDNIQTFWKLVCPRVYLRLSSLFVTLNYNAWGTYLFVINRVDIVMSLHHGSKFLDLNKPWSCKLMAEKKTGHVGLSCAWSLTGTKCWPILFFHFSNALLRPSLSSKIVEIQKICYHGNPPSCNHFVRHGT